MNGRGMPYFDPATAMLVGPLPWGILGATVAVTAAMLGGAGWVTTRQDLG